MAALALTAIGVGLNIYGQLRAGREAKRQAEAAARARESEAGLLDYNAQVADVQAQDAIERGADEESRFRTGVRGLIGQHRADVGAGGTIVGEGSAADVEADVKFLEELDAMQIRNNAARQAWGYKVDAGDIRERARIARTEGTELRRAGKEAQKGARIGAATTGILFGASLLEQKYGMRSSNRSGATVTARDIPPSEWK